MNGRSSQLDLFKSLKKVQMKVYQCSPQSTVSGIKGTFDACTASQKKHTLDEFVSVVVLDEVGLAEDTPEMPLKTLHHLLEHDREEEDHADAHKKVGFLGLSNWSLDPAKNNRALMVRRMTPDGKTLKETAWAICKSPSKKHQLKALLTEIATGYHKLYEDMVKGETRKEFFGLRDFYSVVKMLNAFADKHGARPQQKDIRHAILRNFGGLLDFNPLESFSCCANTTQSESPTEESTTYMIEANLNKTQLEIENRHLLLLTENQAALDIIQEHFEVLHNAVVIFGSSFPDDLDFTKLCRAINRVKLCMEKGKTVILLNQQPIFESLYDALNQYYTYFGGEKHVDIGLGSQRMKCKVHEDFKLVVVADSDTVHREFPIPLINRFEKHYLATSTVLNSSQCAVIKRLAKWIKAFTKKHHTQTEKRGHELNIKPEDIFIGYHKEAPAAIVLQVSKELGQNEGNKRWKKEVFEDCKRRLLLCATPESIVLVEETGLEEETADIQDIYLKKQRHERLSDFLKERLSKGQTAQKVQDTFIQVTTHSQLLSKDKVEALKSELDVQTESVSIQAFATEQEFSKMMRSFYHGTSEAKDEVLILQCDSGNEHQDLLACCRYIITDEYAKFEESEATQPPNRPKKHVVLVAQLPRLAGGCFTGFQMQPWECVHIDELHPHHQLPSIRSLLNGPVSAALKPPDEEQKKTDGNHLERVSEVITTPGFDKLFEFCIIPAMSILKDESEEGDDKEDSKQENTRRVEKLNSLLRQSGDDRSQFLAMMRKRIYLLQIDREQKEDNPDKWLSKVATNSREMKMLTFRTQIRQHIQRKMTGLIAGIIAFADSSNNLQILLNEGEPWKRHMWLQMMNNEKVFNLSIEANLGQSEPQEIPVKSYGPNGSSKEANLPFSWEIYKQIDDCITAERSDPLNAALQVPVRLEETHNAMWTILIDTLAEVSKKPEDVLEKAEDLVKKRVLEHYLPDFIDMVYKPSTKEREYECQMVRDEITQAFTPLLEKECNITLSHYTPLIHAAYAQIKPRIDFYSQMVQLCPEIVDCMRKEKSASQSGLGLDLRAVKHAIAAMQPTDKQLRKSEYSKNWYDRTGKIAPLINQAFSMDIVGQSLPTEIHDLMNEWERIINVRMFATMVFPPKSDKTNMQVMCPMLWFILTSKPNMKTMDTLKGVDKFFGSIASMQKKELLRSKTYKICTACNKEISMMYLLPCGHEACAPCTDQQQQTDHVRCIQCKAEHTGKTFKKQISSGEQKLRSFKNSCQSFRIEFLRRVCQPEPTPPEDDLIDLLLKNVSDPPAEDVDPAADQRMRVMLIQLLMDTCPRKVKDHLDEVFKGKGKNSGHHLHLAILFVQHVEHSNHLLDKDNTQDLVKRIAAQLNGNFEALKSTSFNTTSLEAIAETRFCMTKTAFWLKEIYIEKSDMDSGLITEHLLPVVRKVYSGLSWPREFLIKVLVRHCCPTLTEEQSQNTGVDLTDRLESVKGVLQEALQDDTLGTTEVLQMVNEVEGKKDGQGPANMAVMWRYHPEVTFGTAAQRLAELRSGNNSEQGTGAQHELLHYFMENDAALREVQRLPRIIKFQKLLLQTYKYRITQKQARGMPISHLLNSRDKEGDEEYKELFSEYQQVWNIQETSKTQEGEVEKLERTTTLDKFLPKSNTLIELVRIHNALIDQLQDMCNLGPDVKLLDVKPTHLVTYDPAKDLLPLVTANCSPSLELGQGTLVEYDFDKMENQLMEQFFDGKSRIDYTDTTMVFSDNLTTVHKLENLRKKIPQEPFTAAVKRELREDIRFHEDVYCLVEYLDIAIGFLHTVGRKPDRYLSDFMKEDLGMDPAPLPRVTMQRCQFKHIRALWLLMCNEWEKHAVTLGAIPFSTLTEERYDIYREPLEEKQLEHLRKGLAHTKSLEELMMKLFTCITLTLIKDDVDPNEALTDYMEEGEVDAEALQLPDKVDSISVSQCMYTWRAVYDYSRELAR